MKSTMTALGLALAVAAAGSTSANAQLLKQREKEQQQPEAKTSGAAKLKVGERELTISAAAVPAVQELQKAVTANDAASIPAKLQAAQAVAKTPDEKYVVAMLQLQAANATKNDAAMIAAIQAMLNSGLASQSEQINLYRNLAAIHQGAGRAAEAQAALQKLTALDPNNPEVLIASAQALKNQNKPAEAVGVLKNAIAQSTAAGRKPPESWYKQAVALAYEAKMPDAVELSRQWVAAYPSAQSWRDAIGIYRNLQRPSESVLLDLLRLSRAVNALNGTGDYHPYAFAALQELAPAEAKAVVEEGIAAGKINGNEKLFKDILAEATTKSAGQRDRMAALATDGLASPEAKLAVTAANIHYSYGEYAKAAELYRAALGKTGADKDLLNLRLGMSLARAGNKAEATAALNAVGGSRAQVAKYWLTYLQTQA